MRSLVERYEDITQKRTFNLLHAELIDLDRALLLLRELQPKAYLAVLLCGLYGLDERTAGTLVGISQPAMHKRYVHAIKTMTGYLNLGRKN